MAADPLVLVAVGLAASAVAVPVLLFYAHRGETTPQRSVGSALLRGDSSTNRTCGTCGGSLEAGLSFCWRCGEPVDD